MEETSPPITPVGKESSKIRTLKNNKYLLILGGILVLIFLTGITSFAILNNSKSLKTTKLTSISPSPSASATSTKPGGKTDVLDLHNLPLGDGKVSTSPKNGYVFSCLQNFRQGGAMHAGNWINGDGKTWDLTEKLAVEGDVKWPDAQFSITQSGTSRVITGNGLPVDTETGIFPIEPIDAAYQFDKNPNSIKEQDVSITIPINPAFAQNPICVPMGMIGVALNGVAIYNALDDSGRDAVAHEVQDVCEGHPQKEGVYHYHGPSSCLPNQTENNALIGYGLDGFGIYSIYDANGREITNADLDECHGTTSKVMWNGKIENIYHYVLTREYPYTIGCFKGNVSGNKNL